MKKLLLAIPLFGFLVATGQEVRPNPHERDEFLRKIIGKKNTQRLSDEQLKALLNKGKTPLNNSRPNILPQANHATLSHVLPNGSKIYILPQDNMPCVVPDLSQFNMPNAGENIKITGMPPERFPLNPLIPRQ